MAQRDVAIAIDEHIDRGQAKVSYAAVNIDDRFEAPNDWVEWSGGVRPVSDAFYVDVVLRDGKTLFSCWPSALNWGATPTPDGERDIVRYRVTDCKTV